MNLKYRPEKLDPRLDDDGKPLKDTDGNDLKGPFLPDLFQGFIEIKMPSYPERLRFPKELGIEDLTGDEDGQKLNLVKSLNQLEVLAKCSEKIKIFISSVELVYKPGSADAQNISTIDDLYDFPEASSLITSLCTKFILGFAEKKV